LFSGAGCGHFDWYRILTSFELCDGPSGGRDLIWPERVKYAIEEYVFARFYMYQNVYLHKTTRGFEKILEAMWRRARASLKRGDRIKILPSIKRLWNSDDTNVADYQRIEELMVPTNRGMMGGDHALADLRAASCGETG
jgi:HD superfamily phosphohydrolase